MREDPAVDVKLAVRIGEAFAHRASCERVVDARARRGVREPGLQPEGPQQDVLLVSSAFALEGVDAPDGDLGADEAEDGLGRELSVELIRGIIEDLPVDLVLRDVHHLGEDAARVERERAGARLHNLADTLLPLGHRGERDSRADATARRRARAEPGRCWRDVRTRVREGGRHRSTDPPRGARRKWIAGQVIGAFSPALVGTLTGRGGHRVMRLGSSSRGARGGARNDGGSATSDATMASKDALVKDVGALIERLQSLAQVVKDRSDACKQDLASSSPERTTSRRRLRGRPPVGDGEEAPHGLSRAQRPAEGHHGRPHTAQAHRRRRPGALPRGRRLGRSAPSARRRAGAREGKRERRGAPQRKDPGRAGARGSGRGGRSRRGREANPRPHGRGPGPHRPGLGARARRQRRRR